MRPTTALLVTLLAAMPAAGQSRLGLTVRVRVVDSTNAPLENVAVSLVRGLNETLASGSTDRNGSRVLHTDTRPQEFQVAARRVGFVPATRAFTWQLDTLRVDITLQRLSQRLDTVRVTASQSIRRQRLTVDADAIATFKRPLFDATDIVQKMRPDMIYGLGGRMVCGAARNVFINGRLIQFPPPNSMMEAKKRDYAAFFPEVPDKDNLRTRPQPTSAAMAVRPPVPPSSAYSALSLDVLSVLASIKPEHIEAMEMRDCRENNNVQRSGESAIFVTLKEGVMYDSRRGSYVGSSALADSLRRIITSARVPAANDESVVVSPVDPLAPPPRYRVRLLGLFDAVTGAPVTDAEVRDLATGVHAATTETGTTTLAFMQPGDGKVLITKPGFRPDTLAVRISPADTLPITVLLTRTDP